MAIRNILGAAAVLLASVASAAPTNCLAPVRVISVRGTNEVFGQSSLRGIFSNILGNGIGAVLQGTPYPAVMDDANWGVYGGSVTAGVHSLQGIIAGAVQQCPNQKLVLIGYSQGANVIADALCGSTVTGLGPLSGGLGDHVKAVALFGDPTHTAGQSFVRGGGGATGMIPRTSNTQCAPYTDRIVSYCHAGDPVCAHGGDISQHLNYIQTSGGDAAAFIASKVR